MKDFERIRAIKRAAQGRLLALPGVHSVGIGAKIVAGKRTDEPAIMVFVVKKRPPSDLPPEQLIPAEIEGVKTDIYEAPIPRSLAIDDSTDRPLVAGGQLWPGGFSPNLINASTNALITPGEGMGDFGTLGCIASTGGASPRVVAVTCWHVLANSLRGIPTTLKATPVVPNINFEGTNTPNSLVVVNLSKGGTDFDVFYRTSAADTLNTIASAVAARILAVGVPGLTATAAGATVTLGGPGHLDYNCTVYSASEPNSRADVQAVVTGTNISLNGRASSACAAYVVIQLGGTAPTYGVFVPIAAGSTGDRIASSIMDAISARNFPGVTVFEIPPVNPGDPAMVSLSGVQDIECRVSSDIRVGQATDRFCSKCSKCCDRRIGTVLDARLEVDAALIQLDPQYVDKYRAEIKDIGVVKGKHDITQESSGYPVQKRGRTTQRTDGALLALDQDGDTADADTLNNPPTWTVFRRRYKGAFTIQGSGFSAPGDSGAAVVTKTQNANDPDNNKILGILFAGTDNETWATPIQQVLSGFQPLSLAVETASQEGVDKVVPAMASPVAAHSTPQGVMTGADVASESTLRKISEFEREIGATAAGKRYIELVRRHFPEAQTLVNRNRRVAAAWQRNGGPRFVESVFRMVESPAETLPAEIDGRPLRRCMADIQKVFTRFASPKLSEDDFNYTAPVWQNSGD